MTARTACAFFSAACLLVLTDALPAPGPRLPTQGRAWSPQKLGDQNNGRWDHGVTAPSGQYITKWKIGVAPVNFTYADQLYSTNTTVSIRGLTNEDVWLRTLNGSLNATHYVYANQTNGYKALWGRAGGWVTNFLGAGGLRDDIWALNGENLGLNRHAKVVGYKLRTFSLIDDASFAFDETV